MEEKVEEAAQEEPKKEEELSDDQIVEADLTRGDKSRITRAINKLKKEIGDELEDVKTFKKELFEKRDNGSPSIKERINTLLEESEESATKLSELEGNIFSAANPSKKSIAENIESFVPEFKTKKEEIEESLDKIKDYQLELNGYTDEDGEEHVGIKTDVNEFVEQIKNILNTNRTKQQELFDKIEGLLKGASTVALAKSFAEHKNSFKDINVLWMVVFVLSIASMMTFSIYAYASKTIEVEDMWKYTLGNLPFIGGAVWLAIYASKQRSQNKRLQQEYAYKEDVAKIYYGLKKEVEEMEGDLGKELNNKVLNVIIETVGFNPSETLDNHSHNEKSPMHELVDKLKQMVSGADEQ